MSDSATGELRWFIGKVTHCASNAKDFAEFAEWLLDVEIPPGCEVQVDASPGHAHLAIHGAFEAIDLLYVDDERQAALARIRLGNAIDDLYTRGSVNEPELSSASGSVSGSAPGSTSEGSGLALVGPAESGGDDESSEAEPDAAVMLDQRVSAGRDVNAPIINTTGDVSINDRSPELDKKLHDYLTYIIFISLGIKQSHATTEVAPVVEEALAALTSYHRKTYSSIGGSSWGNYPELRRHAVKTWEMVDTACQSVLGLTIEEARLGLFESPFPEFDLFSEMILVRGGFDPYTGRNVDPYYISRTPVTLAQYDEFCRTLQYPRVPEWEGMSPPPNMSDHPVTGVTLFDTVMFCVWLETATGFRFRLPTESEWCFAATEGRRQAYPWGDEYRTGYASTSLESPRGTTPVNARPEGASASGVLDLVGNVWELTSTLYADDPAEAGMDVSFPPMMFALAREAWWATDRRIPHGAGPWLEAARLVMRGGSWGGGPDWATMDRRIWTSMFNRGAYGGFRVVCSAQRVDNGYIPVPSYLSPRVAGFADRLQLTNVDGSSALTQHDFVGCGGGATAEGEISTQLRDYALGRYQGVGDQPFDREHPFVDRVAEAADPSTFPQLRPRGTFRLPDAIAAVAGETFGESSVERLVNSRVDTQAQELLNAARTEAALRGQDRVTTGHVLLAMSVRQSNVATMLRSFGLDTTKISEVLRGAPKDEGPNSEGNESYTDALVRLLVPHHETHGGLTVEALFQRITREPTAVSKEVFESVGITGETAHARLLLLNRIDSVGFKLWTDDLEEVDAALALLEILPTDDEKLLGARAVLLSARPNMLARAGAPANEITVAEELAREARSQLGGQVKDFRGGLIRELLGTYGRLRESDPQNTTATLAVLDEIIEIETEFGYERYDSPLVHCLINRSAFRNRAGDLEGALADCDRAIGLGRRRHSPQPVHVHQLTLALNNRAALLGQMGRETEAIDVISEALQTLFPSLVQQDMSWLRSKEVTSSSRIYQSLPDLVTAAPTRPSLDPYEATLSDSCQALGMDPDPRFLAYLDYFRLDGVDEERLSSLPVLDPPPLRLVSDEQSHCEFCKREPMVVSGVFAGIGRQCLELSQQILDAEPEATHSQWERCDLCGRPHHQVGRVVTSGGKGICGECVTRATGMDAGQQNE